VANALQAVLDRAAQEPKAPAAERASKAVKAPTPKKPKPAPAASVRTVETEGEGTTKFHRPVRDGKRFIGGHFDPEVARQLRIIAAEDDTTIQALLEEAVQLLFVKKGRDSLASIVAGA